MFYMILFIVFTYVFNFYQACSPASRDHHLWQYDIQTYHINLINEGTYTELDNCNYSLINPKKIINPYRKGLQNTVQQKPFGNFCTKCACCIAIATQVAEAAKETYLEAKEKANLAIQFLNTVGAMENTPNAKDTIETVNNTNRNKGYFSGINITKTLEDKLKKLCSKGFKNYDLRKYFDVSLITDKLECTEHVNSYMDGGWTQKLREMCTLYVSYFDIYNIVQEKSIKTKRIIQILCRGEGIFRDCQNIGYEGVERATKEMSCENCECQNNNL